MAKSEKRLDNQVTIFELLESLRTRLDKSTAAAGSMNIDKPLRDAISEALRDCPLSRYQVAAIMSELLDQDVTKTMIDSWTAESKEQHRFPGAFLPAFCFATKSNKPFSVLAGPVGVFVLPGPEALRAEIQRIDEDINKRQAEKRKRLMFLKEMEGKR